MRIETEVGAITLQLMPSGESHHAKHFVGRVRAGAYDGTTLHRGVPNYFVQGGSPTSRDSDPDNDSFGDDEAPRGADGDVIRLERGVIALARKADGAAVSGAQFVIVLGAVPMLQELGYTGFGRVVEGLETLDRVSARVRDVASFDQLLRPVVISAMQVVEEVDEPSGSAEVAGGAPTDGRKEPQGDVPSGDSDGAAGAVDEVEVIVNSVNVRAAATTGSAVVARLERSARRVVAERSGGWVLVDLGDGVSGWIRDDLIRPIP